MKTALLLLGCLLVVGCGELGPDNKPKPPEEKPPQLVEIEPINPTYTESCSDNPEMAALENAEADGFEIDFVCLVKNHEGQVRRTMSYHPILGQIARMRADDMALNGYYRNPPHVDHDGYGPNYYVCLSGYNAPFCPVDDDVQSNYIESSAAGQETALEVLEAWLSSPGHRRHLLGEGEYYSGQLYYGVGHTYVLNSPDYTTETRWMHYWIFITVHPPEDELGGFEFTELAFLSSLSTFN